MSQEVIRDFLNVPGIEGFALICGQSQSIFYSKNSRIDVNQQDVLFQGILQVVETIPTNFEVFEFHFSKRRISLYRLQINAILLIVQDETVSETALEPVQVLQRWIELDFSTALNMLRNLEGITPISPEIHSQPNHPTLQDLLNGLNDLCDFTAQYLGAPVIVNYLKSSQPKNEWFQQFEIERTPRITFLGESSKTEQPLTDEEREYLHHWISAFVRRCSQVVRDFQNLVAQNARPEIQTILFSP